MDNDIIDFLEMIGYDGNAANNNVIFKAIEGGPKSPEFTQLVEWICKELKMICNLNKEVHAITSEKESDKFLTELTDFLREMGCSHLQLFKGPLKEKLNSKRSNLLVLRYLLSELMAAQIFVFKKSGGDGAEIKLEESGTASDLKKLLETFNMCKPSEHVPASLLFSKIEAGLRVSLNKTPPELIGNPLFTATLTDKQWRTLDEVQRELNEEYCMRREMLLKRLDVTIQSFQSCSKPQSTIDEMLATFSARRSNMKAKPEVEVEDLLAARDDLAMLEKASSASVRKNTRTSINKIIIGRVPDRGGRPNEQEAPPPEMPSWQKERAPGGGGRGGGRGGGGGGRVQGNWNRGSDRGGYHDNRGYQDSRSSRHDNRGGYADNRGYEESRGGYRGRNQGGGGRRDGGRRNYY